MSTKQAVYVAIAATIGNFLQGWDNATIAGGVIYIKKEFNLQNDPTMEGLIIAMSLIGATLITTISGSAADALGRRPMLMISAILYFLSGVVIFFAPNVYILLLGRLFDGFALGLACTLVPIYISETAPSEIRGTLNTIPQFCSSAGTVVSYAMVFGMSLTYNPSWRLMLGVLAIPALAYLAITVFFMPESPRWLVSKGKMEEAKLVLQRLRGREDVTGEMALLVEGLGVGGEASIEEYIIVADNELNSVHASQKDQIKLYGAEEGVSWIAKPVHGENSLAMISRHGSAAQSRIMKDPMVTLFSSVHEKLPETQSTHSVLFSNFGSRFNMAAAEPHDKSDHWDVEAPKAPDYHTSDDEGAESDDNLKSPLLSHQNSHFDNQNSHFDKGHAENADEQFTTMGVGSGWQLAYSKDDKSRLKKIFLHQESNAGSKRGSYVSQRSGYGGSAHGEFIHAAALVSRSVLRLDDVKGENILKSIGKPVESATKGFSWRDLLEPGVKRALIVGAGVQMFQQFVGINGVLYYTPQILDQAGVGAMLSNLGLASDSATLLLSCLSNLLNLPCIGLAMKLMDIAGRRSLLLYTVPVLFVSLIILVIGNLINIAQTVKAVVFIFGVVAYLCTYVMGFGPIPNLLCSEIFPTRVRGICIAICALVYWISNIIVTFSFPILLKSVGLAGVFAIYATASALAWFFVFSTVPETKGMPLEVITEIFSVGAKQKSGVGARR